MEELQLEAVGVECNQVLAEDVECIRRRCRHLEMVELDEEYFRHRCMEEELAPDVHRYFRRLEMEESRHHFLDGKSEVVDEVQAVVLALPLEALDENSSCLGSEPKDAESEEATKPDDQNLDHSTEEV